MEGSRAWLLARDPVAHAVAPPEGPLDSLPAASALVEVLGRALDEALARDPALAAEALCSPEMRDLAPQMGLARRWRLLEWAAEAGLPRLAEVQETLASRREVEALAVLASLDPDASAEQLEEMRALFGGGGDGGDGGAGTA